jgi:hypothetical protein
VQPTLEVGTSGFVGASLYSEAGGERYLIGGYARTNLKPLQDITWDPGDSAQLGAGWRHSGEKVSAWSTFDVRLHTGQQSTHVVWKHKLAASALTFDAIYKSGRLDTGRYIRAAGLGLYYDRRWFGKLYYDPHANFGQRNMVRLLFGKKF